MSRVEELALISYDRFTDGIEETSDGIALLQARLLKREGSAKPFAC
jgi:hypothetical protein